MAVGKIRWFSSQFGYGFIEREDGESFYVHYTDIQRPREPERIKAGEQVEFEIHESSRGPQATHVMRV